MAKTFLRQSKASGSTRIKVDTAIRRGWQPGLPVSDFLRRRPGKFQHRRAVGGDR